MSNNEENSISSSSSNSDLYLSLTNLNSINENNTTSKKQQKGKLVKAHVFRSRLPYSMLDRKNISIWSIIKQCVDKELYKFTIPIIWNEPLSFMQRCVEGAMYADQLLTKSSNSSDPIDRIKNIAGFFVSSLSTHVGRFSKPFNPILGETFEFLSTEKNFRAVCEQVSHHPPISAIYMQSLRSGENEKAKWIHYHALYPQIRLNIINTSVDSFANGVFTIELPEFNEVYTWQSPKISIHNIIIGKFWLEYTGKIEIVNHKLNLKCVLDFKQIFLFYYLKLKLYFFDFSKPYTWFTRNTNRVEGYILNENEQKIMLLYGKWDDCFYGTRDVQNQSKFYKSVEKIISKEANRKTFNDIELIWKTDNIQTYPEYFNYSHFSMSLNELYDDLKTNSFIEIKQKDEKTNQEIVREVSIGPIAPTDSRYRPDMSLYEQGKIDEASSEKHRLEEKQREARHRVESGEVAEFQPLWFDKSKHPVFNDQETWIFNNKYWKRNFDESPDLF